ncbi:MAG: hypothetical protein IPM37_13915 [Hahellaceae bacterium]|nr:hypothetical protein [Hahellaceae bacterium]
MIKQGRSTLVMELKIIADDGRVLGVLENLRHRQVDNFDADLFFNWLYEQQWQLKPLLTSTKLKNRCAPVRFMLLPGRI